RLGAGRRRSCKNCRVGQTGIWDQRAVQGYPGYLDSILRVRCAQHDTGRAAIEDSPTGAQDCLLVNRITKSKTRSEIIVIVHSGGGVETCRSQDSTRIEDRRRVQLLIIVAHAQVQSQFWIYSPIVLRKEPIVGEVWPGGAAGSARAA